MAAGNLSPRQKMINMMYLVLTALLALNVSKEVLNSFFEVNKGIERTTTNFKFKNAETYAAFDNAAENNPSKYKEVRDKVYSLKNSSEDIVFFIQEMKYNLVKRADKGVCLGKPQDVLDEKGFPREGTLIEDVKFSDLTSAQKSLPIAYLSAKSDRYASAQLFLDKNQSKSSRTAYLLSKRIKDYSKKLIEAVPNNQTLISTIEQVCDVSPQTKSDGTKPDWEVYNFNDMPAVSALTILSKIQSDMRNIEADVIDYLKQRIDAKSLKFGEAEGAQIPKSNFVLQGDSFKSTIFIAAKQDGQDPEIFVGEFDTIGNGVYAMRGEEGVDYERVQILNGKGMFATRAKSEGVKSWGGLIITKTETGDKYYPFEGEYMVASKQAVASPTNMNILYIAVDNPIKIAVAGYPASQVTARSRNGTVKVVNRNKGEWIANPKKRNDKNAPIIDLYVTVDGKSKLMGSVEFKVKEVPEPLPKAARIARSKKSVSKGELRAAQMLIAEMQDFYFDRNALSYKIVSYRMNFTTPKGSFSINAEGARFNEEVLTAINNSVVGSTISFTNLKAKRSGVKKPRDLNVPVVYTIK